MQTGTPLFHLAQHAAGGGAVNVEAGILAAVGGRDHEGLAVDDETDVAEKSFIEDAVHGLAIVDAAIGFADHTGARGGHLSLRHCGTNSGQAPRMGKRKV